MSGTYNVVEYSIPNSLENQSSQDVGLASKYAYQSGKSLPAWNCSGGIGSSAINPYNLATPRGTGTSYIYRAISTANDVSAVATHEDSLGYAYWSVSNFLNTSTSNAKYLTVDGVDPLMNSWLDGAIPTTKQQRIGDVTFAHVKDGTYPLWSFLRFVSDPSGPGKTAAQTLITDAVKFLGPFQPNFVPISEMNLVRSHFAPAGVSFSSNAGTNSPSNGTGGIAEAGGDAGGMVYSLQADSSYNADNGVNTGNVGHRQ
jgi:hypothetical protein